MIPLLTLFIAVSGMTYSIVMGIYSLSNPHATSLASAYQLAFNDFFVLLYTGISIAAWVLFLSSAGTTTPLVATLFVLSEFVFVIKEIINLSLFHWYDMPTVSLNASREIQRNQTRMAIKIEAHNNKSWVNLMSALWLTVIIARWCLMPEDLVVGAVSLIALGIVHWKKQQDVGQIQADMEMKLKDMAEKSTPWWVDDVAPQMESTVQSDLIAANDISSDTDRSRERHHEAIPALGLVSQSGIFSVKARDSRMVNDEFMVYSSARSTVGYDWLTAPNH